MDVAMQNCIAEATRLKLEKYEKIRGNRSDTLPFWDLVVITAADEDQAIAFQLQIDDKLSKGELPIGVTYHVFPDPPGFKVGNGGSTLAALEKLEQVYKEAVATYKVLLIHAGGYSQRLPSASLLGKIFTVIPFGNPIYQMLDLKLAMYIEFPSRMRPGVFVTCADDIELFDISGDEWSFDKPGFTAMAQPSPIEIGTGHGVFVFADSSACRAAKVSVMECLEFLHKPSKECMRKMGAVIDYTAAVHAGQTSDEMVYTDSAFYFDAQTAKKLVAYYQQVKPLQCEIDAYSDFLQALGSRASVDYTHDVSNVVNTNGKLIQTRQEIFHVLKGTSLNVIVMNACQFYHLGTMSEYIFHLCGDPAFSHVLGKSSDAFNLHIGEKKALSKEVGEKPHNLSEGGVVAMHSVVNDSLCSAQSCIVEYCNFGAETDIQIGSNCIVSSCSVSGNKKITIPDNTFLHCASVCQDKDTKSVVVVLGIHDSVKRKVNTESEIGELRFLGKPLCEIFNNFSANDAKCLFPAGTKEYSIWQAKLFCVSDTMESAFDRAMQVVDTINQGKKLERINTFCQGRISVADIIQSKDVSSMLRYRRNLYKSIIGGIE